MRNRLRSRDIFGPTPPRKVLIVPSPKKKKPELVLGPPSDALANLPILNRPLFRAGTSELNLRLENAPFSVKQAEPAEERATCLVHLPGLEQPARLNIYLDTITNNYFFQEYDISRDVLDMSYTKPFSEAEVLSAIERAYLPGIPSLQNFNSELGQLLPIFQDFEEGVDADFEVDESGTLQLQLRTRAMYGDAQVTATHRPQGGYLYSVEAPGSELETVLYSAREDELMSGEELKLLRSLVGEGLESSKVAAEMLVRLLAFLTLNSRPQQQPRRADPYHPVFPRDFHDDMNFERVPGPGRIGRHGG